MRSKSNEDSVSLVDEFSGTQLFATKRRVRGRVYKRYRILLEREPLFSLEKANKTDNSEFIRITKNNQLLGLIKDGQLERSEEVEKQFFFSKLDLIPNKASTDVSHWGYRLTPTPEEDVVSEYATPNSTPPSASPSSE